MAHRPRLSLLALMLALSASASAADRAAKIPSLSPIRMISLPGGIASPLAGTPGVVGLTNLSVIPQVPIQVNAGLPAAPTIALPIAQAAIAPAAMAKPQVSGATTLANLGVQAADVSKAVLSDASGLQAKQGLDQLYFGRKDRGGRGDVRGGNSNVPQRGFDASKDTVFIVNDEGVQINGRAAAYYKEVRRLVDKYKDTLDLSESLDVMDDTYADVWSKLATIEAVARARGIEQHNTHLEETLLWVDGSMRDNAGRTIAVHTHRVFFHHATNPQSEIKEGIRRVDRYIEDSMKNFGRGGKAENAMGPLDEVVLAFDTRGYDEIKAHLKQKEKELARTEGKRYRFVYVDELSQIPQTKEGVRSELNKLVKKYKGKGLQKIIEGVIYSRYVGVLLELKTVEHYLNEGYKIEQSGRELFDAEGHYITELDTVVRSPEGRLTVVEAKSARVKLPNDEALADKVLYKLDTYKKHQARMEESLGGPFDVVFSFDVGMNQDLAVYLKGHEKELSEKYGFNVSFIFIDSSPEEDPGAPGARLTKPGKKNLR